MNCLSTDLPKSYSIKIGIINRVRVGEKYSIQDLPKKYKHLKFSKALEHKTPIGAGDPLFKTYGLFGFILGEFSSSLCGGGGGGKTSQGGKALKV